MRAALQWRESRLVLDDRLVGGDRVRRAEPRTDQHDSVRFGTS
jgi:hypothetical protein